MKKGLINLMSVLVFIFMTAGISFGGYTIYSENFETTNGGYSEDGVPSSSVWQWGEPVGWPNAAASGTKCWGTNLSGTYPASSTFSLYSIWIDLSSYSTGTPLVLKWKQALSIESSTFDQADCYGLLKDDTANPVLLWSHSSSTVKEGWAEKEADISFAAGKEFGVYWTVKTDGSVQHEGLYIDDVAIEVPIEKAATPTPEDGSLDVTVDPTLSWVHSGDVSFDVYFGTVSNDLPLLAGGLSEMSYPVSDLEDSTTYYWRVDVRSGDLGVSGDVWSFTTEEGGCIIPIPGGGGSGGCNAAGLTFFGLILLAPLGLLLRKSR